MLLQTDSGSFVGHGGSCWFINGSCPAMFFGSCMVVPDFFEFMVVHAGSCWWFMVVHGGSRHRVSLNSGSWRFMAVHANPN